MDADCPAAPAPTTKKRTAMKKTAAPKKSASPKKSAAPQTSPAGSKAPQVALSDTLNANGASDRTPATQKKATQKRVKEPAAPKNTTTPKKRATAKASTAISNTPQTPSTNNMVVDDPIGAASTTKKKETTTKRKPAAPKRNATTSSIPQTPSTDNMEVNGPSEAVSATKKKAIKTKKQPTAFKKPATSRKPAASKASVATSSVPQTVSANDMEVDRPSDHALPPQEPITKKRARRDVEADEETPKPKRAKKALAAKKPVTASSASHNNSITGSQVGHLDPPSIPRIHPLTAKQTRKPIAGGRKPSNSTVAVRASGLPFKDRKKVNNASTFGDNSSTPATESQTPQVEATPGMGNAPSTQATTPAPDAVSLDSRKRARPKVDSTDDDEPLSKRMKVNADHASAPVPQHLTNVEPKPAGSKQPHTSFMAGNTTDHQSAKASNKKKVRPVKKATGTRKKKAATTESENTTAPDLSSVRSTLLNETEGVEAIYSTKEVATGNDTTGSEVAASQSEATPKSSSTGEVVDTSTGNPLEGEYKAHKAPGEACKTLKEYKAFLISTGFLKTEEDPKNSESLETCEAPETFERPKTKYAIAKERKQAREAAAVKAKADAEIAAAEAAALAEDITYGEYEIPDLEDDILGEDPVTTRVSPKLTIYLRHYSGAPGAEHGIVPFSLKRLLLGSHRIHDLVAHVGAAALEDTEIPLPRFVTRATVTDYAIYTADRTNNISHADAHWTPRRALRLAALALHMADPDCADACASTLARLLRDPDPAAPPLFDAADASAFCAQADALAACLVDAPRNAVARRLARLAPMRRLVVDVLAASPARAREVLDELDEGFYRGFVDAVRARCAERVRVAGEGGLQVDMEEPVFLGAERGWCGEYHFHGRYGLHERCRVLESLEAAGGEEVGEVRVAVLEEEERRAEERRVEEERRAEEGGLDDGNDDDVDEAPRVGKKRKTSDEEMLADTHARASMLCGYWGGRGSDDSDDSSDEESDDEGWPKPSVVPHWLYPIRAVEFEERRKMEEERRKREEEERGAAEGRS